MKKPGPVSVDPGDHMGGVGRFPPPGSSLIQPQLAPP